jgi:hypothetical protein
LSTNFSLWKEVVKYFLLSQLLMHFEILLNLGCLYINLLHVNGTSHFDSQIPAIGVLPSQLSF